MIQENIFHILPQDINIAVSLKMELEIRGKNVVFGEFGAGVLLTKMHDNVVYIYIAVCHEISEKKSHENFNKIRELSSSLYENSADDTVYVLDLVHLIDSSKNQVEKISFRELEEMMPQLPTVLNLNRTEQ